MPQPEPSAHSGPICPEARLHTSVRAGMAEGVLREGTDGVGLCLELHLNGAGTAITGVQREAQDSGARMGTVHIPSAHSSPCLLQHYYSGAKVLMLGGRRITLGWNRVISHQTLKTSIPATEDLSNSAVGTVGH